MRHKCLNLPVDSGIENHFVIWIRQLRPPHIPNLNRFDNLRKLRQESIYMIRWEPMNTPFQNLFVFQEQGRACGNLEFALA
jgi:hypothetical protein